MIVDLAAVIKRAFPGLCTYCLRGTYLIPMRKGAVSLLLITACLIVNQLSQAQPLPATLRAQLKSTFFETLYARTYYSLLDRLGKDGFLPESITGAYEGMYCRTTGPLVALFIETGRLPEAQRTIDCVLSATTQHRLERIPHVIGKRGQPYSLISDEPQIDGQAHVLLAWARLALNRGHTPFEDQTWPLVKTLMNRTCDREHLETGRWSVETGLVRNISFEHSREGRRWDTWDLLTQSFVGATLTDMAQIARRRGETKLADYWTNRCQLLREGVRKNLTTRNGSDTTYLEMRLPDGNGGVPYTGMGWVNLSPVAAGWEALDHRILVNTVNVMQQQMMQTTNGISWMPTDSYPDGTVSNEVIGKGLAWEMDLARREKDYPRVGQILGLIQQINGSTSIYMEGGWLEANGHKQSDKLTKQQVAAMQRATWRIKDAGNGEQTAWWCWAMARLRKEAGLPAEPARPKK